MIGHGTSVTSASFATDDTQPIGANGLSSVGSAGSKDAPKDRKFMSSSLAASDILSAVRFETFYCCNQCLLMGKDNLLTNILKF